MQVHLHARTFQQCDWDNRKSCVNDTFVTEHIQAPLHFNVYGRLFKILNSGPNH